MKQKKPRRTCQTVTPNTLEKEKIEELNIISVMKVEFLVNCLKSLILFNSVLAIPRVFRGLEILRFGH